MRKLPLYKDKLTAIDRVEPLDPAPGTCTRCVLHTTSPTVCMGADGQRPGPNGFTGAILILGDYPTQLEGRSARPFSSGPNLVLRDFLDKVHPGPFVYANAVRCSPPHAKKASESQIAACRGYTKGLIDEIQPSRILCFGREAYNTVLGVNGDSVELGRRGYAYMPNGTPVFMLHAARRVTTNSFLFTYWKNDVKWALQANPPLPPWDGEIHEVETPQEAQDAAQALRDGFAYDTEFAGLQGSNYFQVLCLAATPFKDDSVTYLWSEEALKDPFMVQPLRAILEDKQVPKRAHNLKADIEAVAFGLGCKTKDGLLTFQGADIDTSLHVRAADSESAMKLKYAANSVGMGGHKDEAADALKAAVGQVYKYRDRKYNKRPLQGFGHPALDAAVALPDVPVKTFAFALIPRPVLYRYCALDTVACNRLGRMQAARMKAKPHLARLQKEVLAPAVEAISQIETWGMSADVHAAHAFGDLLRPQVDETLDQIRSKGCKVDLKSPSQLARYLYTDLKLPILGTSQKTDQPKTDAATLKKLVNHHEVIPLLLKYAKLTKLLSTYVDGLIPHIRPDGRIRADLDLGGTRSGRLSCRQPNLQNIPSRGQYAKMAKKIFNAPPGHLLVQLDFSQLEVRVAAMLSQDPDLIQAYIDGVDVHRRTAARSQKISEAEVTSAQRSAAKSVVFGLMYGKTPRTLANEWEVPLAEAEAFFQSVLGAYPVLTRWMEDARTYARENGYCWTYLPQEDGTLEKLRCRQLWHIAGQDSALASRATNGAQNTPIQGTASDFMIRSLAGTVQWIQRDGIPARLTNTVHDSKILECPYDWVLEVADTCQAIMESWPACGVPLVADVDVGYDWGSLFSLDSIRLVGQSLRRGLTSDEIIHLASAKYSEDIGDDPQTWLAKTSDIAKKIGA